MDVCFYLEQIPEPLYCQPLPLFSGASVGQHTRHLIEFFECLLSQADGGVIDYDARPRSPAIEQLPATAAARIALISRQLAAQPFRQDLRLALHYGGSPLMLATSFDRELAYAVEHGIHHLAIIRIGLSVLMPDLVLPEGFGVAHSTLRHRQCVTAS
jgi:hypothetical protein